MESYLSDCSYMQSFRQLYVSSALSNAKSRTTFLISPNCFSSGTFVLVKETMLINGANETKLIINGFKFKDSWKPSRFFLKLDIFCWFVIVHSLNEKVCWTFLNFFNSKWQPWQHFHLHCWCCCFHTKIWNCEWLAMNPVGHLANCFASCVCHHYCYCECHQQFQCDSKHWSDLMFSFLFAMHSVQMQNAVNGFLCSESLNAVRTLKALVKTKFAHFMLQKKMHGLNLRICFSFTVWIMNNTILYHDTHHWWRAFLWNLVWKLLLPQANRWNCLVKRKIDLLIWIHSCMWSWVTSWSFTSTFPCISCFTVSPPRSWGWLSFSQSSHGMRRISAIVKQLGPGVLSHHSHVPTLDPGSKQPQTTKILLLLYYSTVQ